MENYYRANGDQNTKDDCLSDFQLATLIEGSLKAADKQKLIQHINRCSDCRFCWMDASSSIAFIPNKTRGRDWWHKWVSIELLPAKPISALAIIATIVFSVVLFFPLQKNAEALLDEHYALLTAQQRSMPITVMKKMPLPWEHASLSFSPAHIDASELAFAAGMLEGRHTLSGESVPAKLIGHADKHELFYQLGRWMTSLWWVSQTGNKSYWDEHVLILEHFEHEFSRQNTPSKTQIVKLLQRMNIGLKEAQTVPFVSDQLLRQVELAMIQLSPHSLDE